MLPSSSMIRRQLFSRRKKVRRTCYARQHETSITEKKRKKQTSKRLKKFCRPSRVHTESTLATYTTENFYIASFDLACTLNLREKKQNNLLQTNLPQSEQTQGVLHVDVWPVGVRSRRSIRNRTWDIAGRVDHTVPEYQCAQQYHSYEKFHTAPLPLNEPVFTENSIGPWESKLLKICTDLP